jgi:hypothetical protein
MPTEMSYTETLKVVHCWCGIAMAIPSNLYRAMDDEGKGCHCPIGHTFVFTESNADKLAKAQEEIKRQRQRIAAERELREHEERSHAATRGHLTRYRKRVEHGVCPHCNRSFQDLRRHMRSKHRTLLKETGAS